MLINKHKVISINSYTNIVYIIYMYLNINDIMSYIKEVPQAAKVAFTILLRGEIQNISPDEVTGNSKVTEFSHRGLWE